MRFTKQEIEMLKVIVENELYYYQSRDDLFDDEKEYIEDLKRIYERLNEESE